MSVREEDRQKNSCSSRGLGIAAAAIGVGVGAALYYFFNKRQENPSSEGSSSDWSCERQQTFHKSESDTSFTTISEHETSDTSINSSSHSNMSFNEENSVISIDSTSEEALTVDESDSSSQSDSELSHSLAYSEMSTSLADGESSITGIAGDMNALYYLDNSAFTITSDVMNTAPHTFQTGYAQLQNILASQAASHTVTDSEDEWDITTSSLGVPAETSRSSISSLIGRIGNLVSPRKIMTEENQMAILRQQAFRERSWSLEECSICFDIMLRNQDLTSLPCAHNFHTDCIMPWLQEKQTCPNCRKVAE